MNNVERTVDLFANGLNCSQAVLTVFGESYGLDSDMASMLGRPLGGGIGHMAKTCGVVTAAVLILGLATDHQAEGEARKAAFASAQEFFRRFESLHGTTECKKLLGEDMSTPEGLAKIREQNLVKKVCAPYVRDAAAILEELTAI
ncbi:MAG: C-GCAxxG-C-C family protein [Thermodesulfobacteriota bacterium]